MKVPKVNNSRRKISLRHKIQIDFLRDPKMSTLGTLTQSKEFFFQIDQNHFTYLFKTIIIENFKAINVNDTNHTIKSFCQFFIWHLNCFINSPNNPRKEALINRFRKRIASKLRLSFVMLLLHNITMCGNNSLSQCRRCFTLGDVK